jgi:hypothetical protein
VPCELFFIEMGRSQRIFKKRKLIGKTKSDILHPLTPGPSTSDTRIDEVIESSSKKKLMKFTTAYDDQDSSEYVIVDLKLFSNILDKVGACRNCNHSLKMTKSQISGLAHKIAVFCPSCDNKSEGLNCEEVICEKENNPNKTLYDLNIRLVYGLRSIGKGLAAARLFCAVMNLPSPPGRYYEYEAILGAVSEKICMSSMEGAAKEAINVAGSNNLSVAVDGSWQKRGHTSLNGIVSVTSFDTGKVLDVSILSKHCKCPQKLKNKHEANCTANYVGTSGGMEVAGVVEIFQRSIEKHGVKYVEYLGDGDSKGYLSVCQAMPYGPEIKISKIECINHVQKRMGSRLKKLKAKTKELADGKKLGGQNRLTDAAILKVQEYYGAAIRRNSTNVNEMKKAVWAEFFHLQSSNAKPLHHLCPNHEDTWCKYHRAQLQKKDYNHDRHFHLPEIIMNEIKPIFKDLADPVLLQRCLKSRTQNANESLNNVLWSVIPKRTFVGIQLLHFGIYVGVSTFNDGHISKVLVVKEFGLKPGNYMLESLKKIDTERIQRSESAVQNLQKEIRKKRNLARRRLEDAFEEEDQENPSYSAGKY